MISRIGCCALLGTFDSIQDWLTVVITVNMDCFLSIVSMYSSSSAQCAGSPTFSRNYLGGSNKLGRSWQVVSYPDSHEVRTSLSEADSKNLCCNLAPPISLSLLVPDLEILYRLYRLYRPLFVHDCYEPPFTSIHQHICSQDTADAL